jgi:hypothetical protein
VALPIPAVAPVTSAIFPSNILISKITLLLSSHCRDSIQNKRFFVMPIIRSGITGKTSDGKNVIDAPSNHLFT